MSNQKQVKEGGNATLSVKVSQETYELLNILAEGMEHGTNANDLLKMFVQAFIESAKHTGPISSEMSLLLNMLKVDAGWNQAFNFADLKTQKQVAQVILILEQPGREGFGAVMINRPFIPGKKPYMTYCVDEILERATEVTMKGLYQELRDIGNDLGTESMRETLFTLCDAYKLTQGKREIKDEGPQLGNYSDFGRAIHNYGNPPKRKKHVSPDDIQTHIVFGDDDREIADYEVKDWEGEHRQTEDSTEGLMNN